MDTWRLDGSISTLSTVATCSLTAAVLVHLWNWTWPTGRNWEVNSSTGNKSQTLGLLLGLKNLHICTNFGVKIGISPSFLGLRLCMGTIVCVALPLRLERTIIATSKSCLCRCEGYNTHKHTHAHTALIWELDSLRLQVPIKHGTPLKVFQAQDKFLYIANITPNYSPPWACFYSQMLHTHTHRFRCRAGAFTYQA